MQKSHNVNLLRYKDLIKVKQAGDHKKIFDPVRKSWYILMPEEFVRQLVLIHLTKTLRYPSSRIGVERQLMVNKMAKRFDIVVFDKNAKPLILVECKSPKEIINEKVAMQIANYNTTIRAKYLWLSNGKRNLFYEMDYDSNKALIIEKLPENK